MNFPFIEDNDQTRARREHLEAITALIGNAYPNKFDRSRVANPDRDDTITSVAEKFSPLAPSITEEGARPAPEELERANAELNKIEVRLSGRLAVPPRVMGKAAFVHLSDGAARLQIYVRKDDAKARDAEGREVSGWELFGLLDHGDFIGVEGFLFVTKTGELSVHVRELTFLAKALVPMPDKMHGISDPEIRQRQRYADLIASSLKVEREENNLTTREVFARRSKTITEMRRFLDEHGYIEVETPMLSPIASGAAARPFKTHHNALDIDLYLRIAPELYLKRLVVGGFERVYELNRNFRNEGIGYRWNPEFTMLEFYCAYMDAVGMMDFCEEMLRATIRNVTGNARPRFGEHEIDFSQKFARLTMKEAITRFWPQQYRELGGEKFDGSWLDDQARVRRLALFLEEQKQHPTPTLPPAVGGYTSAAEQALSLNFSTTDVWHRIGASVGNSPASDAEETARHIAELFEEVAERHIIQPTFITDFPKPVSPLAKASPDDPTVAERFELYVAGMEVANGFSELNDPAEQHERFVEQTRARERGDDEAMPMDEDYLRALAYGMPPAAGIGIGIDRLVMILTNRRTIRDVILFPHMRPRHSAPEQTEEASGQK
ncbi:MAG TPA: lysine--tRNA ligase [Pyrinomonadaceae bacterium]|nr:lysine--tRNA ligase [Pyrinomonadaceae bacterium]